MIRDSVKRNPDIIGKCVRIAKIGSELISKCDAKASDLVDLKEMFTLTAKQRILPRHNSFRLWLVLVSSSDIRQFSFSSSFDTDQLF